MKDDLIEEQKQEEPEQQEFKPAYWNRKNVDWDRVCLDYRTGVFTTRELGQKYGVSHVMIADKAKKLKWTKDLSRKIQFRKDEIINVGSANNELNEQVETDVIEANARMQADIILGHRKNILRHRELNKKLLDELEALTDNKELFAKLGELLIDVTKDQDSGKPEHSQTLRMNALNRALDLSNRIDSAKKLSETLKVLVALEREAFSIASDADLNKPAEMTEAQINARLNELLG